MRASTLGFLVCCVSTLVAGQGSPSPRLVIGEKSGAYELTVAVSRLTMTIPKGGLAVMPSGSGGPRYFSLEDRQAALIVSGWFEADRGFTGIDAFWAAEQRPLIQRGIQLQNVVKEPVGSWQVVLYDILVPGGRSTHMRAERVQAGTWIDLHLSVTADRPETENRALLRKALESIRVDERAP